MQSLLRWLAVLGTVGVVIAGILLLARGLFSGPDTPTLPPDRGHVDRSHQDSSTADRTAHAAEPELGSAPTPADTAAPPVSLYQNLLVIPDCRLGHIDKQEVPSQRDGQLLYLATEPKPGEDVPEELRMPIEETYAYIEIQPGEKVPPEEQVKIEVTRAGTTEAKLCRRVRENEHVNATRVILGKRQLVLKKLREGVEVEEGDLLALVDPKLALDEFTSKLTKVDANKADYEASVKTRDEAEQRYRTDEGLYKGKVSGAIAWEDVRGAKLTWDKYFFEVISKRSAITQSEAELNQALTVLTLHEIRAKVSGVVASTPKNKGEAVKAGEQVLMLINHDTLQVEGEVDLQYRGNLPLGRKVVIEPYQPEAPRRILAGHMDAIKAVAVSQNQDIVSASTDRTVRVWKRPADDQDLNPQVVVLDHPTAVLSVACSPAGAARNLCLSGGADGSARLWDLSDVWNPRKSTNDFLVCKMEDGHKGAINCVAFSPDGQYCATGGEDKTICLWSTEGKLLQQYANGHRAPVTSVAFLSPTRLVSTGRNDALLLWEVNLAAEPHGPLARVDNRTGEVTTLGVDPAHHRVLVDQSNELRELSLPDRTIEGVLRNPAGSLDFNYMALFSPDGNLILTAAGASEQRLQLWRAPTGKTRAYELRHLVWPGKPATCGAFSPIDPKKPEDAFVVTGTEDRQVVVWGLPSQEEVTDSLVGKITFAGQSVDTTSRRIRVRASVDNKKGPSGHRRLMPGLTATMVVYPPAK